MRNLFFSVFFSAVMSGCVSSSKVVEVRSANGILQHYPQDVKSVEAWYGHPFKIGDTPVLPTDQVPQAELLKHVGKSVKVEGDWYSGKLWKPDEEELNLSSPVDPDGGAVFRGDGILVESIELITP